jgi:hypothetical protein
MTAVFGLVGMLGVALLSGLNAPALPKNYQVQFENAWVKVTRVRYEPMEKVPAHAHTPYPSAYVYLNDGPPVIFRHIGGSGTAATRPATKAGAFRVYRGLEEIHEAENTGPGASEFLRVELKTAAVEPGRFFGKYERPATASPAPVVHFNHPQVSISRVWLPPGESIEMAATEPILIIALADAEGMRAGDSKWIARAGATRVANRSTAPIDLLRFDFKTAPKDTQ